MTNPPQSVHPSQMALAKATPPPREREETVTVYEYGGGPVPASQGRRSEYGGGSRGSGSGRGGEESGGVYTRDDGVLVVRSQPQEIEIVEQIVPVRSKSRARSKSRVRRKVSLDMRGAESPPPFKRLILACDGTWLNSDNGMANGDLAVPSNVTRISRAIKPISKDGIPQIVYYHFGVGSRGNVVNRVINGSTGAGLEENVREAYSFLSNNYTPGDEIYLIGFSRGAFTARSIAGLIDQIGILTKKGLGAFVAIFEDVQHRRDRNYKDRNPDIPFSNKPNASDPAYRRELEARGMTWLGVKVKAIGVWDTVGALGAPRIGWLTRVGLQPMVQPKEMSFYDTKLSNCIEYAFQALALDERRASFAPAIWEKSRDNRTILRQVWFPGVHSNIGGGYDDQQLANITLAWMISQLQPFLDFKIKYVFDQEEQNDHYYERHHTPLRPWSFGEIPNSSSGIYSLGGSASRTPGQYTAVDPHTGRSTGRPLRDTHEYMHASVRARFRLGGPGIDDKGKYDPEPLEDWRLIVEYPDDIGGASAGDPRGRPPAGGPPPDIYWKLRGNVDERDVSTKILPEAPLSRLEREIAERDPETYEYLMWPPRTRPRRRGARSKSRGPRERMSMPGPPPEEGEVIREEVRERRRIKGGPPGSEYRRSLPERVG
ncbi:hypothetical protein B0J12DRAFT_669746 [Macrophomina phaseolina]|uniref:T6SS Phospholipase effector Tle1-like catalytic domain-containing protein n=1 Tax=Macrophomina phaseolina TaxID=35725 RepID=A0ABQ8G519_9PEZI|nr:hypothetical protein B0J12DRAFT_669746 [Macrophomina phaseolina]